MNLAPSLFLIKIPDGLEDYYKSLGLAQMKRKHNMGKIMNLGDGVMISPSPPLYAKLWFGLVMVLCFLLLPHVRGNWQVKISPQSEMDWWTSYLKNELRLHFHQNEVKVVK